ncbi:hypothetical protein Avbf_00351, partial [Armadillidium vulgare]
TIGPLGHWTTGLLDHWTTGPLDHWTIGSLDHWIIGSLDHWIIGPLDHWTITLSKHNNILYSIISELQLFLINIKLKIIQYYNQFYRLTNDEDFYNFNNYFMYIFLRLFTIPIQRDFRKTPRKSVQ